MCKYAILLNPGHNRVYYKATTGLALSELSIAATRLNSKCSNIQTQTIKGMYYCTFNTENKLTENDINVLSRLSFLFVLFEIKQAQDETVFVPIKTSSYPYIDDKITTILKYKGKTNELFTKLMVNIAWLSFAHRNPNSNIRLLDPMAGKGTTLFEGMVCGFDAYGIEQSKQSVHDGCVFLKKYLETERLKHTTQKRTINSKNKKAVGKATSYTYANSKQAFASGDTKTTELIEGDAALANLYFKPSFFDMIVTDLPYGVQHASKQSDSKARSPESLLTQCLPSWHRILKTGGVMVLAWNTKVLTKQKMTALVSQHGFHTLFEELDFSHYVDVSIQRDIIIAKKN